MPDWIYCDHHTKVPVDPKILDSFCSEAADEAWQRRAPQEQIDQILELLKASNYHLMLTLDHFGAYEQVFYNHYIDFIRQTGRSHILALEGEKQELCNILNRVDTKLQAQVQILALNQEGLLEPKTLQEAIRPRSSLFSFSYAQGQSGVIQQAAKFIAICKEEKVRTHIDIGPSLGKLPFSLDELDADFVTFDGALLGLCMPVGVILSNRKEWGVRSFSKSYYTMLHQGLSKAIDQMDVFALELGPMIEMLKEGLIALGGEVHYSSSPKLCNVLSVSFTKIHQELLLDALKKEGVFAAPSFHDPSAISFALSRSNTLDQMKHVLSTLKQVLSKLGPKAFIPFSEESAKSKNMRAVTYSQAILKLQREVGLSVLVDEEDGIVVDVKVDLFGPLGFMQLGKVLPKLLINKTYHQASRIGASLVEKEVKEPLEAFEVNLVLEVIDEIAKNCMDIPIEEVFIAPPQMEGAERFEYPGWESLTSEQKKVVIAGVIESEIAPYVELDAGGVEVVKVDENRVTIAYSGNCTSCFSATGATLDAVGNILRHKVYPDLMVIPDLSLLSPEVAGHGVE